MSPDDELEIRNAIHDYCHFTDDEQFAALGELLSECDLYVDGALIASRDREAIATRFAAAAARARASGRNKIRHMVSNVIVRLDGNDAVARSSCLVVEARGATLEMTQMASYVDRFRKASGGWRFSERRIVVDNRAQA